MSVLNIASTLKDTASRWPDRPGVVWRSGRGATGRPAYSQVTFRQLDDESDALARGLVDLGIAPGTRLVLMVRPGIEFIALTYSLFKVGAVVVLIDPGMGPRRVFRCLDQVDPQGFVAVPMVQALRTLSIGRFPHARFNVTVGHKWFWGGPTYASLRAGATGGSSASANGNLTSTADGSPSTAHTGWQAASGTRPDLPPLCQGGVGEGTLHETASPIVPTQPTDPAAIIFTSGSTGPAKGVVYEHGMFAAQVAALRDYYHIEPGGVDLPGFPLFALFNAAMGVTTVIPDIDPTRPARADPRAVVEAIETQGITQSFGSPAIWKRVGEYCEPRGITLPTVKRIFSAGAPVTPEILDRMKTSLSGAGAEMFTPYGATEALPVCSIAATEVLARTAGRTREGAGTCVGKPFPQVQVKIIEITSGPLGSLALVRELPEGEIGEIIVRGPAVTREYFRQPEATAHAKIPDGDGFWHRMGDVGYLDAQGALWFCGRQAHVVETEQGRLFTDCVEPIFNTHPRVFRTVLVGVGPKPRQEPVIVIEPEPWYRPDPAELEHVLIPELRDIGGRFAGTRGIERFLLFRGPLPVDVRHNIKINRERLAVWAARQRSARR